MFLQGIILWVHIFIYFTLYVLIVISKFACEKLAIEATHGGSHAGECEMSFYLDLQIMFMLYSSL